MNLVSLNYKQILNIIYYEDDKDITILKREKNKVFINENNLVLKEKISYKKNMNIKFV